MTKTENAPELVAPRKAPVRALGDLAEELGCTRAAIYAAYHRGCIGGTLRAGASIKIRVGAFEYHSQFGYGADVPPYGTPAAEAFAAARGLAA